MSKYYRAEDIDRALSDWSKIHGTEEALSVLSDLPAIEVNEGEWVGEADGYWNGELIYDVWYCPFCDYRIEEDEQELLPNFCPNCGAKMKG